MNKEAKQTEENRLSRWVEDRLVDLVEKVSTLYYIAIFATAVICFGLFYYLLTQCGHGIGQDDTALDNATIFTGIYFSIVTISSLGYGDMHPMGISKILACIEVLFGLVMIGIMIAKVTSQRLSYRVKRLFVFEAQKRLENFAEEFNKLQRDFAKIATKSETAHFEEVVRVFQEQCTGFSDYFLNEANQEEYFRIVPGPIKQVGNAIDKAFSELKRIMKEDSSQEMTEIRNWLIPEAIDAQIEVCRLVPQYTTNEDTCGVFLRIEATCMQLEGYFALPEELKFGQPIQGSDEPQQPSGVDDE